MAEKYFYCCNDCGTEYPSGSIIYLCPACQQGNKPGLPPRGVLKTLFNYELLKKSAVPGKLFEWIKKRSFLDLTALKSFDGWPMLKVGNTPLYKLPAHHFTTSPHHHITSSPHHRGFTDNFEVYLKDDSQNPTFSFKDRASALVSAWAKERGIDTIIAASTGNAGSSLAGICASQGQRSVIFVPASAPIAKLTQIMMYGATIIPVKGRYDDAFDLSVMATEKFGFYNRNTAFNPLTIEGKKSVSFELFGELGQQIPDRIFVPLGDGVVVSGVYKGFEDLLKLGIISQMPVIVAVQAEGSPNVVNNMNSQTFVSTPSQTIADSISVDVPRNFYMTKDYLKQYAGEWTTVSDAEILRASAILAKSTGIFSEPAAVAAFAGMLKYREADRLPAGTKNVVLLTGSGLKDLKSVQSSIHIPEAIEPDIEKIEFYLEKNK